MLQSQWTETGITVTDVEPPRLEPGWARLRVAACGICGSDLHRYHRGGPGGGTPGHELAGTILQSEAKLPEALYSVEAWLSCGRCDFCRAGQRNNCRESRILGVHTPGAMAEFVDVPERFLYPVNPALSPVEASIAEPFAVCTHAINLARLSLTSRVLVLGGGSLGLISGLLARDFAARVAVSTRYAHQAEAAKALGLEPVAEPDVAAFAAQLEPDVVIETVGGSANTLEQAIQACKPGGTIVIIGLFGSPQTLDVGLLVRKELAIVGSKAFAVHGSLLEFGAAVDLLPRYRAEIKLLQTHQFPLREIAGAFACAADKRSGAIKVTVLGVA